MQFTDPGGNGHGAPAWVLPLVIVLVLASPVVLGLALRVKDRRSGSQGADPTKPAARRGFSLRSIFVIAIAYIVAFALAVAGLGVVGIPLAFICVIATMLRLGYSPRL